MTQIGIGIVGFGTVGAGVAAGLIENRAMIAERVGVDLVVRGIADLDITTPRGVEVDPAILTTDAAALIADPAIDIVVELIGGTGIAKKLMCDALRAGKPVVTANKKLLAEYGAEIFELAEQNNADVFFGASVGGGIPIIRALRDGLSGNRVNAIYGILNGTCNYILTAMSREGLPFDEVLQSAQELGYAEADPTLDVDGFDTLHKAAILASLAYGFMPDVKSLPVRGIRNVVDAVDITYAAELGYHIKLLAIVKRDDAGEIEIRVEPTLVPADNMLASVAGVFNAVLVDCDLADKTLYYGRGAGRMPTASTVIGDIVDIARNISAGTTRRIIIPKAKGAIKMKAHGDIVSRHYIRISLANLSGSLAAATGIFAKHGVSISAAVQKDAESQFATVIILTHSARQSAIDNALRDIEASDCSNGTPVRLGIMQ